MIDNILKYYVFFMLFVLINCHYTFSEIIINKGDTLFDSSINECSYSNNYEFIDTAQFNIEKLGEVEPLTVNFINEFYSENEHFTYLWDFGDGHNSRLYSPSHVYQKNGSYQAVLKIFDKNNCLVSEKSLSIFVKDFWPNADFNMVVSEDPFEIQFYDNTDSYDSIVSYSWYFGDGEHKMGQNVTHKYQKEGKYSVALTVYDNDGSFDTKFRTINIRKAEPVQVNKKEKNVCNDSSLCFYTSIQDAIDKSLNNDTIVVWPGYYNEQVDYKGKFIKVIAKDLNKETIIDGNSKGPVVKIDNISNTYKPILKGFTIINGSGKNGGGIYINNASPVIENCIIRKNDADNGGGVFNSGKSYPQFSNCFIELNQANTGGGIYCDVDSPLNKTYEIIIENCTIKNNNSFQKGGGIYSSKAKINITKTTIKENVTLNYGAGIMLDEKSSLNMYQSSIIGNSSKGFGGGAYITKESQMYVKSSLITHNSALFDGAVFYTDRINKYYQHTKCRWKHM